MTGTSSTSSSSGSSSGRAAGTTALPRATATAKVATRAATGRAATGRAATGRAATGRAAAPRAATGRAVAPRAASPRAVTSPRAAAPRAASPRAVTSPRAAARAAFAAEVAEKDTNRLHNLPEDLQKAIMKMAKKKKKVATLNKHEIKEMIKQNRKVFIDWLDELKRDGVDDKKRVRNPLPNGGLIYTDKKNGLYPILYNLCFQVFQGDYNYTDVPRPAKSFYRRLRAANKKVQTKSPDSPLLL